MKKILFPVGIFFILVAIAAILFIPAAWVPAPTLNAMMLHVDVPEGATVSDVSKLLVEKHILSIRWGYLLYARLDRAATRSKAGSYDIAYGSSYRQIARLLSLGPARDEISFTAFEGKTIADLMKDFDEINVEATFSDFAPETFRTEYPILETLPAGASLEGYLFPDTYRVWRDQLPAGLLHKQLEEFTQKTKGFREDAAKQGRSFYDVLILASIVEKEAAKDEDRPIIAGIFMNRLKNGMRLQSDATLNYVLKSGRSRLTTTDLQNDSPYNSYTHDGLPPGPISNPGLASMKAALHPANTDYYFFLSDANGKMYYAKTHEEHVRNRYKAYGE
jgi:UPF0755 protein